MQRVMSVFLALVFGSCASAPPRAVVFDWMPLRSGVSVSLRGLCVVDDDVLWASGREGTFLRSTDGGRSFVSGTVAGAESLDFRDVHAESAAVAWLLTAGRPARIYRTGDGGVSWRLLWEDDSDGVFFDSFAFWDRQRAVAFGDPVGGLFRVMVSADAGDRWVDVGGAALPAAQPGEAGFAASGTCVVTKGIRHAWIGTGGAVARVLRTNDGGRSWRAAAIPLRQGLSSTGVFSLAFADLARGVAVGGDYREPWRDEACAATTADGGVTWRLSDRQPGGYRSCVGHVPRRPSSTWVAVGTTGADASTDGGRTWRPIGNRGYHAVAFAPSGDVGFAVGADGAVARIAVGH